MKEELGRTRAELQELMNRLVRPTTDDASQGQARVVSGAEEKNPPSTGPRFGTRQDRSDRQAAQSESADSHLAGGRVPKGGGLRVSREDLRLWQQPVRGAIVQRSAAGSQSIGNAALGLDGIARVVREARAGGGGEDEPLTLSLSESARMMKDPQAGAAENANGGQAAMGEVGASPRWRPGASKEEPHRSSRAGAPGHTQPPARAARAKRPSPTAGQPLRTPEPRKGWASRPLAGSRGADHKLDVNLLASLIRWVGSVKCRLGIPHLYPLLGVFRLAGHMTPVIDKAIYHLASLRILPDESDYHAFTEDDLADALLGLHGIIYGSGRTPVGPAVEFDPADTASWVESQGASTWREMPEGSRAKDSDATTNSKIHKTPSPGEHAGPDTPSRIEAPKEDTRGEQRPSRRSYEEALTAFRSAMRTAAVPDQDGEPGHPRYDTEEHTPGEEPGQRITTSIPQRSSNGRGGVHTAVTGDGEWYGNAAEMRRAYPSDVTDDEWRLIEPLVPRVKPGGRPGKYERREILNGILYQMNGGCSWRSLPHDLPPWKIVHHYYRTWRSDRTWRSIIEALDDRQYDSQPLDSEPTSVIGEGLSPGRSIGGGAQASTSPTPVGVALGVL